MTGRTKKGATKGAEAATRAAKPGPGRTARAVAAGKPTRGLPTAGRPRSQGTLVLIGGHEERNGKGRVLGEVASRVGRGPLVVATVASESAAKELWTSYRKAFGELGVKEVRHLDVPDRRTAIGEPPLEVLEGAAGIFFTGGAQIKLTTQLGGTRLCEVIQEMYTKGGVVAGTSAGASVVSDTMLVEGDGEQSHKIQGQLMMAPGLALLRDVIVDQHFAERGRLWRLLGAVAQNPRMLGIGIDENTAIIVEADRSCRVVGEGAVYVVDAFEMSYTNLADDVPERTMSIFDVRLHLLSDGDTFDLESRRPAAHATEPDEPEARPKGEK